MQTLGEKLVRFYENLQPPALPAGFDILHPQKDEYVMGIVKTFFDKFYHDTSPRTLILGINPGRHGAGITGVNFTAPLQLTKDCGIEHKWPLKSELSAEFIYAMITAMGGPSVFYKKFFLGSMSPLGFVKNGKNINYYDDVSLMNSVRPFILDTIRSQLELGFSTKICFCIGEDKNLRFLKSMNEEHHFFESLVALPHPRFIMQYKRKSLPGYIQLYLDKLGQTK